MWLPETNSLTLEDDNEHMVVDDSQPPAIDDAALLALLPNFARRGDSQVRAAYLAALRKALNLCWAQWGQVLAAQRTPSHAWGPWLDGWGSLLKRFRTVGEEDPQYRERLLTPIDMVTPNAIRKAVALVAEKATLYDPFFLEPAIATMYVADDAGTAVWTDFAQPDDLYLWRADADGHAVTNEGALIGPDTQESTFWLFLPEDPMTNGSLLSDRIISEVEQRKAAGVTWMLIIGPNATHAL